MITTYNLIKKDGLKKLWHRKFPSLTALANKACESSDSMPDMYRSSRKHSTDAWAGGNFEEAVKMTSYGWSEGFKAITELTKEHRRMFDDLFPRQDLAKQITYDVEGETIDVGLAVQGVPESMLTTQEDPTSKVVAGNKMQRIIFANSVSCCIDKQTIFNYGAIICCLVNAMEGHGFRTEIINRNPITEKWSESERPEYLCVYDTICKTFDESPDYNKLAFTLASAMMLRRFVFALQEQEDKDFLRIFRVNSGNGYPCNYKDDLVEATDIYIPYIHQNLPFQTIAADFRQLLEIHFKETQQPT